MAGVAPRVMHGARAQVVVDGVIVGVLDNVSYNWDYQLVPIPILGRFSDAELVHTGVHPVAITANGYRCIDAGPHVNLKIPTLQDLLTVGYMEFVIVDRQTNARIASIHSVKGQGYSQQVGQKGVMTMTAHFMGLLLDDESVSNVESPGASDLPPGR